MGRTNKSGKIYKPPENEIYSPRVEKAIVEICLFCPLPVKKCRPHVCKRYREEVRKIKEQEKTRNDKKKNALNHQRNSETR